MRLRVPPAAASFLKRRRRVRCVFLQVQASIVLCVTPARNSLAGKVCGVNWRGGAEGLEDSAADAAIGECQLRYRFHDHVIVRARGCFCIKVIWSLT